MPAPLHHVKAKVLDELWLPLVQKGGEIFFPTRRNHKKMRLFTLTDMEYQEIKVFESNKLTKREDVVAWTYSQQQAYRLDTELGRSKVICEGRLDDVTDVNGHSVSEYFPCHILNIDFCSQRPSLNTKGRIERELRGGKLLVGLLNDLALKGFVMLYTTIFDQIDLSVVDVPFAVPIQLDMPGLANTGAQKASFVQHILSSIVQTNNYSVVEVKNIIVDVDGHADQVFSVGILALRNN